MTEEVAWRDNLQGAMACQQNDLEGEKIPSVIGDEKVRAALDARGDDGPVLEITRNSLKILVLARHQLAYFSQGVGNGLDFLILKMAEGADVRFTQGLPDFPQDVGRNQRLKITAYQSVEHPDRRRFSSPQNASNEDVGIDNGSNACPRHAGLASRLG